jgi:hypothetical protein
VTFAEAVRIVDGFAENASTVEYYSRHRDRRVQLTFLPGPHLSHPEWHRIWTFLREHVIRIYRVSQIQTKDGDSPGRNWQRRMWRDCEHLLPVFWAVKHTKTTKARVQKKRCS